MHGEEVGRAVLQARTLGRHHLPHEPVPRGVLRDAVADPLVVGVHRVGPQLRSAHEQDVRPLVGPIVDELRPRQEQVDQTFPFPRRGVGQVDSDLLGRRQATDRVEEGAADERGVVARRRGLEVKPLELLEHEVVDKVLTCRTGEYVRRKHVGKGHQHAGQSDLRGEPRCHGPLAVPDHGHQPGRIDRGDCLVGRGETGPARDVAGAAIAVGRGDAELLRHTRRQVGLLQR